jgi:hypothetical protein
MPAFLAVRLTMPLTARSVRCPPLRLAMLGWLAPASPRKDRSGLTMIAYWLARRCAVMSLAPLAWFKDDGMTRDICGRVAGRLAFACQSLSKEVKSVHDERAKRTVLRKHELNANESISNGTARG